MNKKQISHDFWGELSDGAHIIARHERSGAESLILGKRGYKVGERRNALRLYSTKADQARLRAAPGSRKQWLDSVLILDNLRAHHSKPVKAWLKKNKEKIRVFCLSGCSLEFNPEKGPNADFKHGIKVPVRTRAKLEAVASRYMSKLEQNPERVCSHFCDPRVAYAICFIDAGSIVCFTLSTLSD